MRDVAGRGPQGVGSPLLGPDLPLQRKAEAEKVALKTAKKEKAKKAGRAKGSKQSNKAKARAEEAVKAKRRNSKR
ncbi:hypothetical protein [Streptomyces sp. NPDC059092]|uniref:hypothetical protein n=1 Tax=Streptomyces sp. NPDC059092 TaxID=3346725 RepID=UPI0036A5F16E